ncbi:16S rRNA (uracil(1498)-N(3))-methyltransferase [Gammaproteobacteria bacterium]|nr:16S rRNA (uracil(1498)-N(3))-methyltransferase [Gammaproteobacteria bacterium]MDA9997220.1 16S rRNA (uracil(1498)-N(3))-methyltransferase [Gammaproteobacteria bacterium]
MKLHRFYSKSLTQSSLDIELDDLQSNHLKRVLRLHESDEVEVFNGTGLYANFVIKELSRNNVKVVLNSKINQSPQASHKTSSLLPILKKDSLTFMIQKIVEIGMHEIILYRPKKIDQSVAKKDLQKIVNKLEEVAISACKQSGNNYLPKITLFSSLKEALDMKNAHNTNIIAFNFSGKGTFLQSDIVESEQIIISGPESGFSDDELELLNSHNVNIRLLGKNILRAETAAIVGATLLQNYLGEL